MAAGDTGGPANANGKKDAGEKKDKAPPPGEKKNNDPPRRPDGLPALLDEETIDDYWQKHRLEILARSKSRDVPLLPINDEKGVSAMFEGQCNFGVKSYGASIQDVLKAADLYIAQTEPLLEALKEKPKKHIYKSGNSHAVDILALLRHHSPPLPCDWEDEKEQFRATVFTQAVYGSLVSMLQYANLAGSEAILEDHPGHEHFSQFAHLISSNGIKFVESMVFVFQQCRSLVEKKSIKDWPQALQDLASLVVGFKSLEELQRLVNYMRARIIRALDPINSRSVEFLTMLVGMAAVDPISHALTNQVLELQEMMPVSIGTLQMFVRNGKWPFQNETRVDEFKTIFTTNGRAKTLFLDARFHLLDEGSSLIDQGEQAHNERVRANDKVKLDMFEIEEHVTEWWENKRENNRKSAAADQSSTARAATVRPRNDGGRKSGKTPVVDLESSSSEDESGSSSGEAGEDEDYDYYTCKDNPRWWDSKGDEHGGGSSSRDVNNHYEGPGGSRRVYFSGFGCGDRKERRGDGDDINDPPPNPQRGHENLNDPPSDLDSDERDPSSSRGRGDPKNKPRGRSRSRGRAHGKEEGSDDGVQGRPRDRQRETATERENKKLKEKLRRMKAKGGKAQREQRFSSDYLEQFVAAGYAQEYSADYNKKRDYIPRNVIQHVLTDNYGNSNSRAHRNLAELIEKDIRKRQRALQSGDEATFAPKIDLLYALSLPGVVQAITHLLSEMPEKQVWSHLAIAASNLLLSKQEFHKNAEKQVANGKCPLLSNDLRAAAAKGMEYEAYGFRSAESFRSIQKQLKELLKIVKGYSSDLGCNVQKECPLDIPMAMFKEGFNITDIFTLMPKMVHPTLWEEEAQLNKKFRQLRTALDASTI
eukprot:g6243.t1